MGLVTCSLRRGHDGDSDDVASAHRNEFPLRASSIRPPELQRTQHDATFISRLTDPSILPAAFVIAAE